MKSGSAKAYKSRRGFIKDMAYSSVGFTIIPRHVMGGKDYVAPSDKVVLGIIGAGGKGRQNTSALLELEDVSMAALADPAEYWNLEDFYYRSEAGRGPVEEMINKHYQSSIPNYSVKAYKDFRVMLETEKDIDAIVCSTPDHTHAYISILAMQMDKHVYCEKPLTHNIWEARKVRELATARGLATQMGNSGHSRDGIRSTVEYIRAGIIGPIKEVHAWVPATRWLPGREGLPKGSTPLPDGMDWDLWLGPTEKIPYHSDFSPVTWRDFWIFGCGALGDFGCHDLDAATWALNLQAPVSVEVKPAGLSNSEIAPYGEIGYYKFDKMGDQKEVDLTWYSGGLQPPRPELLPDNEELPRRGTMFVGEKGLILNDGGNRFPIVYPESLRESERPAPTIPRSNGHFRDWIDAIKDGSESSANFAYGARLTEITLLGVLSLRLGGQKIYWDAKAMKAIGLDNADKLIREPVRKGWEFPDL